MPIRLKLDETEEIQERVRRVDNALQDGSVWGVLDAWDEFDERPADESGIYTGKIAKRTHKTINSLARLTLFLKAALLIRNNYGSWVQFLNNVSDPPPVVFESFAENRRLVILLFICETFKVFRLEPGYPFLIGEHNESNTIFIEGEEFNREVNEKPVVDLWVSMNFPKEVWEEDSELLESDLKHHSETYDDFALGDHFCLMLLDFGLRKTVNGDDSCFDDFWTLLFDRNGFVRDASIALSFDHKNELLETIYQLFPQFPELIPDICREYYLGTIRPFIPCCKIKPDGGAISLTEDDMRQYKAVTKVIEKEMNVKLHYRSERNTIHHKGVLYMIKKYPHLFARWETDRDMAAIFRQLTG